VSGDDTIGISGVGVVSAAGRGLAALTSLLAAGGAACRPLQSALPVGFAGTLPEAVAPRAGLQDDRKGWLAFDALDLALADAGLPARPAGRVAVFLGTGLSSVTADELETDVYPTQRDGVFNRDLLAADLGGGRAAPGRHLPARVTERMVSQLGATGPSGTNFSACAAAAQAIAEGLWTLRRGEADIAIVGGHDSMVHPLGLLSFVVLGALSPDRCRPFDRRRDGFMIGEGAAILVLERVGRARARGSRPRALLLGAGTSADAWNPTAPHPDGAGAERAMRRALADAGLPATAVGYVNAHGTGTPVGDAAEASAVRRVVGSAVPLSSIKGAVGHTIAAAGAVEAAACIGAMQAGFLPGTAGLDEPDTDLGVQVLTLPVERPVDVVLSNSFGFGGQNCTLVLGRAGPA
jgi:3-oxoacyl-[acyl-carrier-protein] synthase II